MLERPSMGVTRTPKEKNQKTCQECYSHDNKKPLRSASAINVTEMSCVLSLTHTRVSGVLQMPLRVLPSQGMTFGPQLVRGMHRECERGSSSWWLDCLAAGGTERPAMAIAIQVTPQRILILLRLCRPQLC